MNRSKFPVLCRKTDALLVSRTDALAIRRPRAQFYGRSGSLNSRARLLSLRFVARKAKATLSPISAPLILQPMANLSQWEIIAKMRAHDRGSRADCIHFRKYAP
jgi:hypothetical protein